MTFSLTIAGVAHELKAGTLQISRTANGRTTASFAIISQDRSYRPALDAEVIIEVDGTRIFGGFIHRPVESGFANSGIITSVNAVDFNGYVERRVVLETIPAGTLEAALDVLIEPYLNYLGVTLDASQVTGPDLPDLVYDVVPLQDVLTDISKFTGSAGEPYVWRIDDFKTFTMYQPSTVAAPFDLVGDDLPEVVGDIEVETSREQYANTIIIKRKPAPVLNHVETFTGDGTTHIFTLGYVLTGMRGVVVNDGVDETLVYEDSGHEASADWIFNPSDNTIRRMIGDVTPNPPDNGNVISITYDGNTPDIGITVGDAGEIATYGGWEKVYWSDSVTSDADAITLAEGYLAQHIQTPKTIRYTTWQNGIIPGMTQEITVPSRNLSGDVLITEVVTRDLVHRLSHRVTAVSGNTRPDDWRDVIRNWTKDRTGGGADGGGVRVGDGDPGGQAAPPNRSVQFNRLGAFGGDASFHYPVDGAGSVVCGPGSSITATLHEGCAIFGKDCTIN